MLDNPRATGARALAGLIATLAVVGSPAAQTLAPAEVGAGLGSFFEAYLGRPLDAGEASEVGREFVLHFGAERCEADCAAALTAHLRNVPVFREDPGGPADLLLRQAYLTQAVLGPRPAEPALLRLLAEPDPIAVVNRRSGRLMTQADVAALVDLARFARSDGPPTRRPLSPEAATQIKAQLDRAVGAGARRMPIRLVLAAEIRAGLEREWPELGHSDRERVRRYLRDGAANPMPEALFARLLKLDPADVRGLQAAASVDDQLARMWADLDRQLGAQGDALVTKSALDAVGRASR